MSLNKVMLIGNVGKDPEVRYLDGNTGMAGAGNTKVASFTLATTERYRDRAGELRENTEWHNIVVWRNLADTAEKYVRKGTQLYIEGRLRTRSWVDQTGAKRFTTEVVADTFQLLGRKTDGQAPQDGGYAPSQPSYQQNSYQQPYQQRPAYQQAPVSAAPAAQPSPVVDLSVADNTDDLPF